MRGMFLVAFAAAIFGSSGAFAANLVNVDGKVFIDSGNGFHRVSGSRYLKPGSRVMAHPGSSAVIRYENGCRETVSAGSVVTIQEQGACTAAIPDEHVFLIGAAAVVGGTIALGASVSDNHKNRPVSP